jgi:hypothetical protein
MHPWKISGDPLAFYSSPLFPRAEFAAGCSARGRIPALRGRHRQRMIRIRVKHLVGRAGKVIRRALRLPPPNRLRVERPLALPLLGRTRFRPRVIAFRATMPVRQTAAAPAGRAAVRLKPHLPARILPLAPQPFWLVAVAVEKIPPEFLPQCGHHVHEQVRMLPRAMTRTRRCRPGFTRAISSTMAASSLMSASASRMSSWTRSTFRLEIFDCRRNPWSSHRGVHWPRPRPDRRRALSARDAEPAASGGSRGIRSTDLLAKSPLTLACPPGGHASRSSTRAAASGNASGAIRVPRRAMLFPV